MKHSLRLQLLTSPLFITGLIILVLNDHWAKIAFGNFFTGKISDFAGLFIFPLFLLTFFPRYKKEVFIFVAFFFVWWKSTLSQGMIDWVNFLGVGISRVVDAGDLWALLMLPFAWQYEKYAKGIRIIPAYMIACIAFISFCATSLPPGKIVEYEEINKSYEFPYSKTFLAKRLNKEAIKLVKLYNPESLNFDALSNSFITTNGDTIARLIDVSQIHDEHPIYFRGVYGEIEIRGNSERSQLTLKRLAKYIPAHKNQSQENKLIFLFEKKVIKKLRKVVPESYYW
ncbi:MAG: hypothetical protein AAFR87_15820 [Bacteroidota bacterium]